ncbi:MAG: TonB-dependent receptor [Bacteroidota bacterium]
MKSLFFLIIIFFIANLTFSQEAVIKGRVTDASTRESLPGVNIYTDDKVGTISDVTGNYMLKLLPGEHNLNFYFIGYKKIIKKIKLNEGDEIILNIKMVTETELINEVVVSAGKFEQKLSDVTVSMEIMKPEQIENMSTTRIDDALNYIPGLEIIDTQPSIRGGSGYSFGAGSRVLVLVDDLPIITPDVGDTKWNFVPLENISQIEVIKGAASSLFGSSALNGVINIRTAFPGDEPKTKISAYSGIYMNPQREELIWWGNTQPIFAGTNIFHSRKIGNLDMVVGAHAYSNDGYRENENDERLRGNLNLRYRDKKIEGLSYGVNSNIMVNDKKDFFMWLDDTTGGYRQPVGSVLPLIGKRLNIDPFIGYFNKNGDKHSLRTRYFFVENVFKSDSSKNSSADQYYGEYQYHKKFKNKLFLTSGISMTYAEIRANLFGNHFSSNLGLFSQADKKIGRLSLSFGVRAEYFRIDTSETVSKVDILLSNDTINLPVIPVIRMGANYRITDYTFARASFGQGFRFPSIAEKYTMATISSLKIFPNPGLTLERGWNAEIGIKQGLKISNWNGYLDIAGFWTEYRNMMEYAFWFYDTVTFKPLDPYNVNDHVTMNNMGFQSQNVGHAQITGVDVTFTGEGEIFGIPATILLGYVYTNPVDLTIDANDTTRSTDSNMLKYRYYHSAKGDLQLDYKKFSAGFSFMYYSFMINVDEIFLQPLTGNIYILPGYMEYREKHNKGYSVFDIRMAYDVTDNSNFSIIIKNVFNKEYMTRPGDIRPPRSLSVQYSISI